MSTPTHLHVYRCSFCKTIATSTIKTRLHRCGACLRMLAYQWSQRIETDADRALAERGLVFDPWRERATTPPLKKCAHPRCYEWRQKSEMVYRDGLGYFCSTACADRDAIEAARVAARVEQLYQEKPWMRPMAKERA